MNLPNGNKKTVLLVGCSGLLGTHFVQNFGHRYNIVGVSRSRNALTGGLSQFIQGDIACDWQSIADWVSVNRLSVDAVIYNAVRYDIGPLIDKEVEVYIEEFRVGLVGPLMLTNELLAKKLLSGDSSNVNSDFSVTFITSGAGLGVVKGRGLATYSSIKSAIHMISEHMDIEYGQYGLRVNSVAPGSLLDRSTLQTTLKEVCKCVEDMSKHGNIFVVNKEQVCTAQTN